MGELVVAVQRREGRGWGSRVVTPTYFRPDVTIPPFECRETRPAAQEREDGRQTSAWREPRRRVSQKLLARAGRSSVSSNNVVAK